MREKSDHILLTELQKGDYSIFNQIFKTYYGRLCAYVFEIIKDDVASEEIVQELFLVFWNKRHKIDIRKNLTSYLFTASRNATLNYIRSEKNRTKMLEPVSELTSIAEDNQLDEEEFINFLENCIEQLPERSKQVFIMSRLEGIKQKDIAERLDISVKTIKNQIWKSMLFLKSCLQKKEAL